MDRLTSMSVFAAVVEHENFTAAAEHLNMSRASASKYVSDLEDSLGGRLLNRTTRRISLTEAGKAYYERCKQILEDIGEAECVVTGFSSEPRGLLRINAPMSFGIRQLGGIISRFCQALPAIRIDLSLNDRFVDVVEEGYDLVIRIGQLEDSSLVARKLAPCHRVLCASSDYLAAYNYPSSPEALTQHNCLHYSHLESDKHWILEAPDGTEHRVTIQPSLVANNGDVLCSAAIEGLGIVMQPTFIVGDAIRAGKLEIILPNYRPQEIGLFAIYPSNRHLSAKVRTFIDFVAEEISEQPVWDRELFSV